jgi:hypothetical protein
VPSLVAVCSFKTRDEELARGNMPERSAPLALWRSFSRAHFDEGGGQVPSRGAAGKGFGTSD